MKKGRKSSKIPTKPNRKSTAKVSPVQLADKPSKPKAENSSINNGKKSITLSDSFFVDIHCRDDQMKNILAILTNSLQRNIGGVLFFSGPPGSGKTFVSQSIITTFQKQPTKFINVHAYVNCLTCISANNLLHRICREFKLKGSAINDLKNRFKNRYSGLLVVDEADRFHRPSDLEQLTQILEVSMDSSSTLIIIVITNAVDLYNRVISNTLRNNKDYCQSIQFSPYSRDDLIELLQTRTAEIINDDDITFEQDALVWCANKFSISSGDFRDAFHACELAIESARRLKHTTIRITDVSQVTMSAMSSSMSELQFYKLPLHHRLVVAVIAHIREENINNILLLKILQIVNKLCTAIHEPVISEDDFWYTIDSLVDTNVIRLNGKRNVRGTVTLTLNRVEYRRKMEANPFLKLVHSKLSELKL
ncbi:hypothetical protein GJ496_002360 [Pomphorhynchus laevis]|nr:hypothetical protein GJ496_002360 [Pomphorhynchus laevis]